MRRVLDLFCSVLLLLAGASVACVCLAPVTLLAKQRSIELSDSSGERRPLIEMISELADRRVVYIGEQHDRFDHHLNQLAIIQALHAKTPQLAIGLELAQQPFQAQLDAYVAGSLDEDGLLRGIEYFSRWGYDFRLYRPIFQYARDRGVPLIALNIDRDLHGRAAQGSGLSAEENAALPVIDTSDSGYRERLRAVFEQHAGAEQTGFERFYRAQLLWDESMAERIAEYLSENPMHTMVVLAGGGHIAYGHGIPNRVQRRLPVTAVILLPADDEIDEPGAADYRLHAESAALAPAGRMGVMMELAEGVAAGRVLADSAAEQAGIRAADRIVAIGNRPIESIADVRLALLDRVAGDRIHVDVQRGDQRLRFQLTLRE